MNEQTADMDARARLSALRVLDGRKQRLETELKSTRKTWSDALTELTKAMHELIDQTNPVKSSDCRTRLNEIREAREEKQQAEADKKKEIDSVTSRVSRVDAAMVELIRTDTDDQMGLDLGGNEVSPGLRMTSDTAETVGAALSTIKDDGGELSPDLAELELALESMGMADLTLAPEPEDDPDLETKVGASQPDAVASNEGAAEVPF